jgi:hypothetical protein
VVLASSLLFLLIAALFFLIVRASDGMLAKAVGFSGLIQQMAMVAFTALIS